MSTEIHPRGGGAGGLARTPLPSPATSQEEENPALGAGGTSLAARSPEQESEDVQSPSAGGGGVSPGAKLAAGAAAIPAAGAAAQIILVTMITNMLKNMMMTLMALAQNLWNIALGIGLAIGKALVGAVMSTGTAISGAVGGAISTAAGGFVSVLTFVIVAGVAASGAVAMVNDGNVALRDSPLADCRVVATKALSKLDGAEGSPDAQTLANAQLVYSVLSAWGMSDENAAGILGNWDAESKIDPTSVQNYFEAPHQMTQAKQAAAEDTGNGIGLGQWTFGRNSNLRAYAGALGEDWWTLTVQLGFMLSPAEGSDAGIVKGMISTPKGTPAEAALYFHSAWERSADTDAMAQRRADYATKWMALFSGWSQNKQLADSILAQAGTTIENANSARVRSIRSSCVKAEEPVNWTADGNAPGAWGGYSNGKIPLSVLTPIPWSDRGDLYLRSDATKALIDLSAEFKSVFGYDIAINDAYRDYDNQVKAKQDWCAAGSCQNAATPGTSNHGWALAIDIGLKNHATISYNSPEYLWLKSHAGKYGWVHPAYMEPGGTGPFEPWHWEFYGVA